MSEIGRRRGERHGNAREALIKAAGDLLERAGATRLSLRAVAEHAGLSRQAPYNHFADKEAMLAALVTDGFRQLEYEVRSTSASLAGESSLAAASEAYIAFARTSPALYRLMFSRELVNSGKFPDAVAASNNAFSALIEIVEKLSMVGEFDDLSLTIWCALHGYATLCNEMGLEPPDAGAGRAQMFSRMVASFALREA